MTHEVPTPFTLLLLCSLMCYDPNLILTHPCGIWHFTAKERFPTLPSLHTPHPPPAAWWTPTWHQAPWRVIWHWALFYQGKRVNPFCSPEPECTWWSYSEGGSRRNLQWPRAENQVPQTDQGVKLARKGQERGGWAVTHLASLCQETPFLHSWASKPWKIWFGLKEKLSFSFWSRFILLGKRFRGNWQITPFSIWEIFLNYKSKTHSMLKIGKV